jgi:hypothetical protein
MAGELRADGNASKRLREAQLRRTRTDDGRSTTDARDDLASDRRADPPSVRNLQVGRTEAMLSVVRDAADVELDGFGFGYVGAGGTQAPVVAGGKFALT